MLVKCIRELASKGYQIRFEHPFWTDGIQISLEKMVIERHLLFRLMI